MFIFIYTCVHKLDSEEPRKCVVCLSLNKSIVYFNGLRSVHARSAFMRLYYNQTIWMSNLEAWEPAGIVLTAVITSLNLLTASLLLIGWQFMLLLFNLLSRSRAQGWWCQALCVSWTYDLLLQVRPCLRLSSVSTHSWYSTVCAYSRIY